MGRVRHYSTNAERQREYRKRQKLRRRGESKRRLVTGDPLREIALARFRADTAKCFQRHIREVTAERDPHPVLRNLKNATVSQISNRLASQIILRFEWLGTMPEAASFSCGLWPSNGFHRPEDLLGAVVFTKGGNTRALSLIAPYESTMLLARGACVMHAGRNAASFLISRACKLAARDHMVTHFLAYSDPEAGERGTIYKALNWQCVGETSAGREGRHRNFVSPSGEKISSYQFNRQPAFEGRLYRLEWDGKQPKYQFLRHLGWSELIEPRKLRWLHVSHARQVSTSRDSIRPRETFSVPRNDATVQSTVRQNP